MTYLLACFCGYEGQSVDDERDVAVCPRCRRPCLPGIEWQRAPVPSRLERELRALLGEER